MKRIVSLLFYSLLFLLLLLAIDQSFVHLPLEMPGFRQSRSFYLDFRSRLLGLGDPILKRAQKPSKGAKISVERLIEVDAPALLKPKAASTPPAPGAEAARLEQQVPATEAGESPRYLYPDAAGQLQFADRLEEIPEALRSKAQRLAE